MSPRPEPWPADLDARYEFLEEAGRGGMGVVYKARDRETSELVAVKVLKPEIAADQAAADRFINEVRLSRRITHKNVCRVYEFSRAGSTAYLSMEFVDGESLRSILSRLGSVTLRKGIQIARQICSALREAHEQGIVHRDLKPENVMLDRSGNVKVMDFGIARLLDSAATRTGGVMGTPAYMAPEQAESREIDARTDIYAAGLILYELFTGRTAFIGETPVAIALKQIRERPPAPRAIEPSIPPELDAIVMRCLEKDPSRRYQSAAELDAALAAVSIQQTATGIGADTAAWPAVVTPEAPPRAARKAPRLSRRAAAGAAAGVLLLAAAVWAYRALWTEAEAIPFTRFHLDNGLQVLVSEDQTAPTVSVVVTYHVGARDEREGRSGFAHLFEHMMFSGSLNVGRGEHAALVANYGGVPNGGAQMDFSQYWQTVPSNQLDLVLFLEADRMRSLKLDQTTLDTERGTVIAEILQRVDNQAYGRAPGVLFSTAYDLPAYRRMPTGSPADVRAATLQDIADFFKIYYAPNNAVLTVVGNVDAEDARAKIERYFQHIPAQPPPPVPDLTEPPQTSERRSVLEDPFAPARRTYIAYKGPPAGRAEDWEALQVLVTLVGDGTSSRLHQKLVREKEAAAAAAGGIDRRAGPGLLTFVLLPTANRDDDALLAEFDAVLKEVRDGGISQEELDRTRTRMRLGRAILLQSTLDRAMLLGEYQSKLGSAEILNTRDRALGAVTREAVRRAANEYLEPERRTILRIVPAAQKPRPAPPAVTSASMPPAPAVAATPAPAASRGERLNRAPVSKDILRVALPRPREVSLGNGLTLLVVEDRRAPLVAVRFDIRGAGPLYDPPDVAGLAVSAAGMLVEGTASRTSRQIAEQLDALGVRINTAPEPDFSLASVRAIGLSDTFGDWFPVLADVVANAAFPADEVTIAKRRLMAEWSARRTVGPLIAAELFNSIVYGTAAPPPMSPSTISALDADRLRAWHRDRYAPQNVVLTVVGAVDGREVESRVRATLGGWQRTAFSETLPALPPAPGRTVHLLHRPGSVQPTLMIGARAIDRVHADYLPAVVANRVLGVGPAARLFTKLREERGWTYSAQSLLTAYRHGGDWRTHGDTRTDVTRDALAGFLEELRRLGTESIPAHELDDAKRATVANFALTLEQLPIISSYVAIRRVYGLSVDYWERYAERIMAVSAEDARRVAATYLDPAKLQIVAVGDREHLRPILAPHGPVKVIPNP